MPTTTRTGRASGAARGRFARSTATPRRSTPTQGLRRRREPEPRGLKKIMGALIPTAAAKKAAPSSGKGKAGGFALVAAAAGMAFKNRDKLSRLRRREPDSTTASGANNAVPPSTPTI